MVFYFCILIIIVMDQITKHVIDSGMEVGQSIPVFENIFHITYVQNFGAAFSMLSGKQSLLIIVTFAALTGILSVLIIIGKKEHWMLNLSLSLIAGGGFGNLLDRIRLNYVVDFLDFRCFPIFNLADICVTCGCVLLILYLFCIEPRVKKLRKAGEDEEHFNSN